MSFWPKTADVNFLQSTVDMQVKETMKMSNASEFVFGMELDNSTSSHMPSDDF